MASVLTFLPLALLVLIAWAVMRYLKRSAAKNPSVGDSSAGRAGVGGWLLLLVLGLMFLGPLLGAGRINSDFMSAESQYPNLKAVETWMTYKSVTWLIFLITCCLSFYAGYGLLKGRHYSVVSRAKILLWVIGPLASLFMGVLIPMYVFGKVEPDPQFIGNLIASVIGALIWTAYLSRSKRVKATYVAASSGGA
jgi:hypothetical protein